MSPALDVVEVARPVAGPGGEAGVRAHPRPQPRPRLRPRGGVAEVWWQLGPRQHVQPGLGGLPASAACHLHKHALAQSCLQGGFVEEIFTPTIVNDYENIYDLMSKARLPCS